MTRSNAVAALVAIVFVSLWFPRAIAQPLPQELRSLLLTNPEILARRAEVESARQEIPQAFSGFLPRMDFAGEVGPERIDSPQRRAQFQGKAWRRTKEIATFRVTQNLFDGFETPASVKAARFGVEAAEFTLMGTRQDVLFDGIDAYIDVLRQMRLVELARLSEETIMRQLGLEDERVERGAGITVDVLQTKSRLQVAKERRVAFEGDLADAIARYIQVFDHEPQVTDMENPAPPAELLPEDVESAIRVAQHENPALGSSLSTVASASEQRRIARADLFPTFDVVGEANFENNNDLVAGKRTDYSIVLQATWNLFDGYATRAGAAQAAHDYRASQDNHDEAVRGVIEATRLAWHRLRTARERVDLLENAVNIAAEVFAARRRLRQAGRETVINVLDAENEVNDARITLTDARYDAMVAVYQLLQAMGRLDVTHLRLAGE